MSTLILNRGGLSGGLKPELIVKALSGSTIDLIQNGVILDTYTLGAEETERTFAVKIGTYTVKSVLGSKEAKTDVVIDAVAQYAVELEYKVWLYRAGDECEDVTGGWIAQGLGLETAYNVPNAPTLTKNATNMVMSRTGVNDYRCGIILPRNKIDFTGHKTINAVVDFPGTTTNCLIRGYFRKDSLGSVCIEGINWLRFDNSTPAVTNKTVTGDISTHNGMYVPYIALYAVGSLTTHKIWLE